MTQLAFDPKLGYVSLLCYFEGAIGQTSLWSDRGWSIYNYMSLCSISNAVSRWGKGSLFFASDSNVRLVSTNNYIGNNAGSEQIIQGSFYPTDVAGKRYIYSHAANINLYIEDGVLKFRVTVNASDSPEYIVSMPGIVVGQWYDYALRLYPTGMSLEVNGVVIGSQTYGAESKASFSYPIYIGCYSMSSMAAATFRGYMGPLRWTTGNTRDEDIGVPAYRFPMLSAVDPHREKVVFHSHFDPNPDGAIIDEKGRTVQNFGTSVEVSTSAANKCYGSGTLAMNGYARVGPSDDFKFGSDDFTIEFNNAFMFADNSYKGWAFSIVNSSGGVVLSLSTAYGGSWNWTILTVNGVEYSASNSAGSFVSIIVVRRGTKLAVFNNFYSRMLFIDIGSDVIDGDGYFYIGKAPAISSGGINTGQRIDEMRVTKGVSRYDPNITSQTYWSEPFSNYGPKSLAGQVLDENGNPISRKVRAYRRVTGALVSEAQSHPVSGDFKLPVGDIDEHFVIAFDDSKNALIYDRVIPEIIT